tara:strand:- start:35 stop:316 length:282 start_codon:yes stop_codon:yes gene_type:complete
MKKAKNASDTVSFLIKCNLSEKVKIPIKQIRKIIIFVMLFPVKNETGRQKNNIFNSLKFMSEKFLDGRKGIFCIKTLCYIKYLFNKKKYKEGV